MRILITNDDGIFAEGIYRLAKQMQYNGEVVIVAPDGERSASGHAITMRSPLMVKGLNSLTRKLKPIQQMEHLQTA